MMANKFGVSNMGKLVIHDNYNIHDFVYVTCDNNPEYTTYCFYPSSNIDGDYVKLAIHSFMISYMNDVRKSIYNACHMQFNLYLLCLYRSFGKCFFQMVLYTQGII